MTVWSLSLQRRAMAPPVVLGNQAMLKEAHENATRSVENVLYNVSFATKYFSEFLWRKTVNVV